MEVGLGLASLQSFVSVCYSPQLIYLSVVVSRTTTRIEKRYTLLRHAMMYMTRILLYQKELTPYSKLDLRMR